MTARYTMVPPDDSQVLSVEEVERMTLQVGLVGSDGIVLASDRLVNTLEQWMEAPVRTRTSKFFHNDSVVCCWSGHQCAERAASHIKKEVWANNTSREEKLGECGNKAWELSYGKSDQPRLERKVLVAFPADCTLWEMEIHRDSIARPVFDKVMAGDLHTTTVHLLNHYIPSNQVPVSNLIRIAAHMIRMGHRENNAGIDGLEIAIVRRGEPPFFLSREQESELSRDSESIHVSIADLLLRPYEYQAPSQ